MPSETPLPDCRQMPEFPYQALVQATPFNETFYTFKSSASEHLAAIKRKQLPSAPVFVGPRLTPPPVHAHLPRLVTLHTVRLRIRLKGPDLAYAHRAQTCTLGERRDPRAVG